MTFSPRKIFTFILFLLPGIIFSQVSRLHVVKDNLACTYGLKNDSGKWVVPAQYTEINTQNNWINFVVMSGSKYGVLDGKGKVLLPVVYDKVVTMGYPKTWCYILVSNKKYGVVDTAGNPIIPFDYDEIKWNNKCRGFNVKQNDKWGALDKNGKVKLPMEFSEINDDEHGYGYFLAKSEKNYFLLGYGDSTGMIIPCIYRQINSPYSYYNYQNKNIFVVRDSSRSSHVGLINSKNEIIIPVIYDDIWLSEKYSGRDVINRIIAEKGDRYDHKETYGVFTVDGDTIISPGTKLISNDTYNYGSYGHFDFNESDTIAAKQKQKWGLLTGKGEWITAQDYDSIIAPEYVPTSSELRWIVMKSKKYGTLDAKGKIFLPIVYDQLNEFNDNTGNSYSNYRGNDTYYFFGKKNGKFGSTDSKGKDWVPYVYDTVTTSADNFSSGSTFFFTNKTDALYFERYERSDYYSGGRGGVFPLKYQFKINDSLIAYRGEYFYYVFEDSTTRGKVLLHTDVTIYGDEQNANLVNVVLCQQPKWNYYSGYNDNCDTITFDKTGKLKVNPLRGIELVCSYYDNGKDEYVFRSKEKKLGVISKSGKIIIPAIYYGFQQMDYDDKKYIWLKFSPDTSCPFYQRNGNYYSSDCPCGWTLCDSLLHPVSKLNFDYPFIFYTNPQTVFVNGKAGLWDSKKKKLITPCRFSDIISIYGNSNDAGQYYGVYNDPFYGRKKLFYAIRDNGEFGVIDSTGKWITDSTYTELMSVPARNKLLYANEKFSDKRFLYNGKNGRMIMDENGVHTEDPLLIDSLLSQTFVLSDFHYGYYWVGDGGGGDNTPVWMRQGPAVESNNYAKHLAGSHWKDSLDGQALFFVNDYLGKNFHWIYWSPYPYYSSFECHCTTSTQNPDWHNYTTVSIKYPEKNNYSRNYVSNNDYSSYGWKQEITFLSPQGFSLLLSFNPDSSKRAWENPGPYYLNFRKTPNGFVPVTLDSIFCDAASYPFVLNKLIISAIAKRDDLNLDCNNPQSWFFLSHKRFYFSQEGLKIIIDNYHNQYSSPQPFEILIPWKEIQPYSRAGGIADDFVGNSSGEHCRVEPDSSSIDFKFQHYNSVRDFYRSDFLKREKMKSFTYFRDGNNITGIRFCCEGNKVYDVYFSPINTKHIKTNWDGTVLPKKILKKKIQGLYCIKNCHCS